MNFSLKHKRSSSESRKVKPAISFKQSSGAFKCNNPIEMITKKLHATTLVKITPHASNILQNKCLLKRSHSENRKAFPFVKKSAIGSESKNSAITSLKSANSLYTDSKNVKIDRIPSYMSHTEASLKKHCPQNYKSVRSNSNVLTSKSETIVTVTNVSSTCEEKNDKNKIHINKEKEWKISDFQLGCELGSGRFGKVFLAREKMTRFIGALKVVNVEDMKRYNIERQMKREIQIQSHLIHTNIIKILCYFRDEKRIYMLLEYAPKGELYTDLKKMGKFGNIRTATYVFQISSALKYCHDKKVIHRDLKPENILLGLKGEVKLGDFGWSVHTPASKRQTFCGTVEYLAPEIARQESYDHTVDIWALGVLMFECLVGTSPFASKNQKDIFDHIKTCSYKIPSFLDFLSRNLIKLILKVEPTERLNINGILSNIYIEKYSEKDLERCNAALEDWKYLEEKKALDENNMMVSSAVEEKFKCDEEPVTTKKDDSDNNTAPSSVPVEVLKDSPSQNIN